MRKVRWGVLGCADIVERRFLPSMQEVSNGLFDALATRGESERLNRLRAKHPAARIYTDYDDLLADSDIDAIYIPLPNALHVPWTLKAIRAGKHVLCEKPIACRAEDVVQIEKAARERGVHVMEAFACLHSPLFPTVRAMVENGEIGELHSVSSSFCYRIEDFESNINANPQLHGGAIHDVGCYNILTIRQLTGREPLSVVATASFLPNGVDAHVNALLDMGDGIQCHSLCSLISASRRGFSMLGSRGYIAFDHTPNTWGELKITLNNCEGNKTIALRVPNTYAAETEQMGRCILSGESPRVSLEESRRNVRALEMLHRAIGSWMSLG